MKTALILHCHPEPRSFTTAWADASAAAAQAAGYRVLRSDPHGAGFDPAVRAEQYPGHHRPFDVLKAQETRPLPGDVAQEVEKLQSADLLILHFPIWWFAPPAMLKGWVDRVLVHGTVHDVDRRFDTGLFVGRQVLFCVTTGARDTECGPDGREGDASLMLWPLAQTFRYCGFEVFTPVLVHGVHGYHRDERRTDLQSRLERVLADQGRLLQDLPSRPRMPFNADSDFDESGRLKADAPSHGPFIRHP